MTKRATSDLAWTLGVTLAAVLGCFWLFGDVSLNLADEGFLWQGVLRTLHGDVPLRDFQSYEPGRYYWILPFTKLFGQGILGMRAGTAAFWAVGLFGGLWVMRKALPDVASLILAALVISAWEFPAHKLFEPAMAMIGVLAAARMLERPSIQRHFWCGAVAGLSSFFGRNHALYLALGTGILVGLLLWKETSTPRAKRLLAWALGGAAGALPMLAMMLFVDGFAASLMESTREILKTEINIGLPYPWLWRVDTEGLSTAEIVSRFSLALVFTAPFIVYPIGWGLGLLSRGEDIARRAPVVAASVLGTIYLHHAWDRSDSSHLAQCITPLWIAILCLPAAFGSTSRVPRWILGVLLFVWSCLAVRDFHPQLLHLRSQPKKLQAHELHGDSLRLTRGARLFLSMSQGIVARRVPEDEPMFIAPSLPGLYPIFDKHPVVHDTYFLRPASEEVEAELIRDLEQHSVDWAWITMTAVDSDPERVFPKTNPRTWDYLVKNFQPVAEKRVPQGHLLLRRKR